MPVAKKGREILKEPVYRRFRKFLIDEIIKTIDQEGGYGSELKRVIDKTLKEEKFRDLVEKLVQHLSTETRIDRQDCPAALSRLMEEDIAEELKDDLGNLIEERKITKKDRLYQEGVDQKLWHDVPSRYIGAKTSLWRDVWGLIMNNSAMKWIIGLGIGLLILASLLFKSVYKAIITGLTLSAFSGPGLSVKLANIIGAVGGILIFFVFLTLIVQYLFLTKSRDERIRAITCRYLGERRRG